MCVVSSISAPNDTVPFHRGTASRLKWQRVYHFTVTAPSKGATAPIPVRSAVRACSAVSSCTTEVWELLVYDLERSGTSSQGARSRDGGPGLPVGMDGPRSARRGGGCEESRRSRGGTGAEGSSLRQGLNVDGWLDGWAPISGFTGCESPSNWCKLTQT